MVKAEKSVSINAPLEKVFAFIGNPANIPEFWPEINEVRNIKRLAEGGSCNWLGKKSGIDIDGFCEVVEYIPNRHIAFQTTKAMGCTVVFDCCREGDGTGLHVSIESKVPVPALGTLAESLIIRQNEREAEILLSSLKMIMEA